MAEITVTISGRDYNLICDDGEEERVAALAGRIDSEAGLLTASGARISETRLLLMSALMLADKLDEAETALERAAPDNSAEIAAVFDDVASRVEKLAEAGPESGGENK